MRTCHRIAEGPDVAGWCDFERALLRMVDELRYDAMVSDATWQALGVNYSDQQMMESLLTAAQYQFVSMILNSLGIQLDPELQDRLPRDLVLPALAARPAAQRLKAPRIKSLTEAEMTQEQRELVRPKAGNGPVPNLYATMVSHPKLYGPYAQFDRYVRHDALLPSKARELLIMRTALNIRDGYGWAYHVEAARTAGFTEAEIARVATGPSASGWSEEHSALLQAADELHREAFVSNATWQTLLRYFDEKRMISLIATVGGSAMTGLMVNSLGIQVDAGLSGLQETWPWPMRVSSR